MMMSKAQMAVFVNNRFAYIVGVSRKTSASVAVEARRQYASKIDVYHTLLSETDAKRINDKFLNALPIAWEELKVDESGGVTFLPIGIVGRGEPRHKLNILRREVGEIVNPPPRNWGNIERARAKEYSEAQKNERGG